MMTQSKRSILSTAGVGVDGSSKSCLLSLFLLLIFFLLFGCGKNHEEEVTNELAASFENSLAKDEVIKAKTAFEEGRYNDSLKLLHAVVGRGTLTERQRKAIGGLVGQLLQAVHEDSQLSKDTQLHRMMELLVRRTMGEA